MTKHILFAGALLVSGMSQAQGENLVPNGSFESMEKKPKKLGSIESANGWTSPTGARADLFTSSKVSDIDVPLNFYGSETASDGGNYAGIVAFSKGDKLPRTYLMTRLNAPMKKGLKYCVSFDVSIAEGSKYACNQIGLVLSNKAFGTDAKTSIDEKASVLHRTNKVFNGSYSWETVCGSYVADGGEKYITIGNFSSNEDTKSENFKNKSDVKAKLTIAAYYYIDNVRITLVDEKNPCNCPGEDLTDNYSKTIYQKMVKVPAKSTPKDAVEMQRVYFAFGRTDITKLGEESLDTIAEIMKANPEMKLQVKAFTTKEEVTVGEEKSFYANMDNKRCNAVMAYLMEKGIAESRLIASPQGADDSEEAEENEDDDIRQAKNRRVLFVVR